MPNGWKKNARKVSSKEKRGGSSKRSKKNTGAPYGERYIVGKVQVATLAKKYLKEDFNIKDWNSLKFTKSL